MPYIKVPLRTVINVEKIITIFELSVRRDFEYSGESHDFYELNYVAKGEVITIHGGVMKRLKEGDFCLHGVGDFHDLHGNGTSESRVVIISFESHSSLLGFFKDKVISIPKELRPNIFEMLKLSSECLRHSPTLRALVIRENAPIGAEQLLRGELERFFIKLIQSEEKITPTLFTSRDEMHDKLTTDIKEYLESNLYSRLNLDELCQRFHFGKSHLCHIFKSKTELGIIQYFLKQKLCESQRLLRETDRSVSDISDALCFDSPQYFSRIFKKETGQTPTAFRELSKLLSNSTK